MHEGERIGLLVDFLVDTFDKVEFRHFLDEHGYGDAVETVNPDVAAMSYIFSAVQAMHRRGLVTHQAFEELRKVRPKHVDRIGALERTWFEDQEPPTPTASRHPTRKVYAHLLPLHTTWAKTSVILAAMIKRETGESHKVLGGAADKEGIHALTADRIFTFPWDGQHEREL